MAASTQDINVVETEVGVARSEWIKPALTHLSAGSAEAGGETSGDGGVGLS